LHSTLTGSRQTRDSGESVKSRIKAQDLVNSLGFHDGQVQCVASGHAHKTHHYFLRALRSLLIHSKNLIDDIEPSVKRRLYRIATIDGGVAVQDPAVGITGSFLRWWGNGWRFLRRS
jgi:hypothetical protein